MNNISSIIDTHPSVTVCRASAGTGKTYTLAAYYVGLLLSGEDYRSILAITFTNKATAEMSERIIRYLHALGEGEETEFLQQARRFMLRDTNAPDAFLRQRAKECFQKMLLDYDNVQVQTIDSFLQTLLAGLAGVLQTSAGLRTELDIDHVIREAVDQLLRTEMSEADRAIIEDYMQLKLDQESQWDVRESLVMMAKELYNESVQMLDADHRICFDARKIAQRREEVERQWANDPRLKQLKDILDYCHPDDYNRYTKAAYERLKRSVEAPEKISAKDRFRGVSDKYCNADEMAQASALAEELAPVYNTLFLTIRFSRDLELMSSLQALIQRNLTEANCALLARTASTLSRALHTGDADFILEKAGIRYKHVLIDEFQDTSQLQWSVIKQLLLDVLAGAGNTLLIVGDIKQSIYRWRNGDWHIMDSFQRTTSLTRNYRSREEVVRFNLTLFDHIIADYHDPLISRIYSEGYKPENLADYFQAKKTGGYIRFKAFANAKDEELAMDMFDRMEELLQRGAAPSDMMVLVRYKSEAVAITDLKSRLSNEQYPLLTQTALVSSDSFQLDASTAVKLIIAALRYVVHQDVVARRFIEMTTDRPGIIDALQAAVTPDTPLYEAVSELIRVLLTDADGHYAGTETAYLNAFLDRTREYVGAYGSTLNEFLVYWDDTLHAKPIPVSSTHAIQIMTVHASKGLQAQTLFVPFCHWEREDGRHKPKVWCEYKGDFVPIQYGPEMQLSAYHEAYTDEQINLRVDNLNMLYVALTRAEDNLYVSTSYSVNKDGKRGVCNHVGKYLMDCYNEGYEVGEPIVESRKSRVERQKPLEAELWANSEQVRFVQSQEGAMYTDYGDEAYRRVARMDEGTLCHEIFAHIRKADELEAVLDDFETRGEIQSKEQRQQIQALISSAWEGNEEMRDWFTAPWELHLEEAIYIDRHELRPDRVMINPHTKEAVVLDYKFGNEDMHKYHPQVRGYMQAMKRLGYAPVRGYLWYARKHKLQEVPYGE